MLPAARQSCFYSILRASGLVGDLSQGITVDVVCVHGFFHRLRKAVDHFIHVSAGKILFGRGDLIYTVGKRLKAAVPIRTDQVVRTIGRNRKQPRLSLVVGAESGASQVQLQKNDLKISSASA